MKRTGEVVSELRAAGLKSRRALEVFLDSRPELQPDRIGGRLAWTPTAIARVREALIERETRRSTASAG